MQQYSFRNDYSEGAHPRILQALVTHNLDQQAGYGEDEYTLEAARLLGEKMQHPHADIHLVSGGTQANLIVIGSILKPYESVIAATTGHISVHEAGAIEATGHKINTVSTPDGKLTSELIQGVVDHHTDEHMVKPRLVFISQATETGTIYKKKELEQLSSCCRSHDLLLYLDGARLGSALCASDSDLTLAELAKLVDVFYIGGTKNGLLFGEAIVILNDMLKPQFRFHLKQRGALLAKGRTLGIQFVELFKDGLYFDMANHTNALAATLTKAIADAGYSFLSSSTTNQIFPLLPLHVIAALEKKYQFYVWSKITDDLSAIRLVTSWATQPQAVDAFIADLQALRH